MCSGRGILAEICSAADHGFHGLDQTVHLALYTNSFDSDPFCFSFQLFRWINSDQQDENVGVPLGQVTSRFQSIHLGHDEIHQREVRFVIQECRQRMTAVPCFPNYDPLRTLLQGGFNCGSCRRAVIHHENANQEMSLPFGGNIQPVTRRVRAPSYWYGAARRDAIPRKLDKKL
jgi:hypothetical protein